MPTFIIYGTIELSASIDADTEAEAVAKAPSYPECEAPDWDTVEFCDYEVEKQEGQ
jgi:hypothetical protein